MRSQCISRPLSTCSLPTMRDIVFALAGNHAGVAADAGLVVDHHAPLVELVIPGREHDTVGILDRLGFLKRGSDSVANFFPSPRVPFSSWTPFLCSALRACSCLIRLAVLRSIQSSSITGESSRACRSGDGSARWRPRRIFRILNIVNVHDRWRTMNVELGRRLAYTSTTRNILALFATHRCRNVRRPNHRDKPLWNYPHGPA